MVWSSSKWTIESHENKVVIAAIWRLAVCVCGVMNKASMCGRSVHYYITSQPISSLLKSVPRWLHHEGYSYNAQCSVIAATLRTQYVHICITVNPAWQQTIRHVSK